MALDIIAVILPVERKRNQRKRFFKVIVGTAGTAGSKK